MFTFLDPAAHCVIRGLIKAGSVVATGDLTAGHFDLHGGDLQIDAGGSVSAIVSAADLDLTASGVVNVQGTSIDLVSTSGDIALNAGGGGVFIEGAGPITFGPNNSGPGATRLVLVPNA